MDLPIPRLAVGVTPEFVNDAIADGIASLWTVRHALLRGRYARLVDLARLDGRIEAHLDAAVLIGKPIWERAAAALGADPGAAFLAACMVQGDDARALEMLAATAFGKAEQRRELASALISGLAWVDRDVALSAIDGFLRAGMPELRAVGIAVLGARRITPAPGLEAAATDPSPLVRARAFRTAGQLGCVALRSLLLRARDDTDQECRFWAAWSAVRLGAAEALDTLSGFAWESGPRTGQALEALLRRLDLEQASQWLRQLAAQPGRERDLVHGAAAIGDPRYVPWLIAQMEQPGTARLAGEAFATITGVELATAGLAGRRPSGLRQGPSDAPDDEDTALDEDDGLPWPDPAHVRTWWRDQAARFAVGQAYFMGVPKSQADFLVTLREAPLPQRDAAALELAYRRPAAAMFEPRARARLQRDLLTRAAAATQAD